MQLEVLMPTLNSGAHLDASLKAVKGCLPVSQIIAADGHSTDETLEILGRHGAKVFYDGGSLGAARQTLIDHASSSFYLMLDSDVVLEKGPWCKTVMQLLKEGCDCVVLVPPMMRQPLQRFVQFYWRLRVSSITSYLGTTATLFKKEALQGIRIPPDLDGTEDIYMMLHLLDAKKKIAVIQVPGVHYHSLSPLKGRWIGASLRRLQGRVGFKAVVGLVLRNVILYPMATALASLATRDASINRYGLSLWKEYVKGYRDGRYDKSIKASF